MALLGTFVLLLCAVFLLGIQYVMIVADIRNNTAQNWEIVVGLIPFGPYVLMILTGIWYLLSKAMPR